MSFSTSISPASMVTSRVIAAAGLPSGMNFTLTAGGTGGHMVPAHALAAELLARGHHVMLITDEKAGAGAVVGQLGESGALGSVRGRADLGVALIEMRYVSGLDKLEDVALLLYKPPPRSVPESTSSPERSRR